MAPLAFPAFGQNGLLKPFAKIVRQFVDFVPAIDLNRFACRVESDLAMLASAQVLFELGPHWNAYCVVDEVVQMRHEL
jgi:hypothetical protein